MGLTNITVRGTREPVVRYVYLVQDVADAARMGGTAENTYTTFQAAYDAAVVLQAALGGSNSVIIQVGNTTAATVGNLALAVVWNTNIRLVGISSAVSVVGNITFTNTTANNLPKFTRVSIGVLTLKGTIIMTLDGAGISSIVHTRNASGLNTLNISGSNSSIGAIDGSSTTLATPNVSLSLTYSIVASITLNSLVANSGTVGISSCRSLQITNGITVNNTATTGVFSVGAITIASSTDVIIGGITSTMASSNNTGSVGGLNIDANCFDISTGLVTLQAYNVNAPSDAIVTNFVVHNTTCSGVFINHEVNPSSAAAAYGGRITNLLVNNCIFNGNAGFYICNNVTTPVASGPTLSIKNSRFDNVAGFPIGGISFLYNNVTYTSFIIENCNILDTLVGINIGNFITTTVPLLVDTANNSLFIKNVTSPKCAITFEGSNLATSYANVYIRDSSIDNLSLIFNTSDLWYYIGNSSVVTAFRVEDVTGVDAIPSSVIESSNVYFNVGTSGLITPTEIRSSSIKGILIQFGVHTFYAYTSTLDFTDSADVTYAGELYTSNLFMGLGGVNGVTNNNSYIV